MKDSRPIGVYDSGVGGLSVLMELRGLLPHEDFVFVADQLNVPYGEKSKSQLIDLGCTVSDWLIRNHDIKMLVVACNTSTCGAISLLRQKYPIPIVGTVPAIRSASNKTNNNRVACISTPYTSKSEMVARLINEYCAGKHVENIGCDGLEDLVEEGRLDAPDMRQLLSIYLSRVKDSQADCLVLGCTHYPFLKNEIHDMLGPSVELIDSGQAIAKQAKRLLELGNIVSQNNKQGTVTYVTTGDSTQFNNVASKLLGCEVVSSTVDLRPLIHSASSLDASQADEIANVA